MKHVVALGEVQQTLLIPLYARAVGTARRRPILRDPVAVDMVSRIDYDFGRFGRVGTAMTTYHGLRTAIFDEWISAFLAEHPTGTVVEIGAGLSTRFERLDNGAATWIDIDLPDSLALRRQLLPESERRRMVEASVLDEAWTRPVLAAPGPRMFVSEGVLVYLQAAEVRRALRMITRTFPGARVAFDTYGTWMVSRHAGMGPLAATRARLSWGCDDPRQLEEWGIGLRLIESRTVARPQPALAARLSRPVRCAQGLISALAPARLKTNRLTLYGTDIPGPATTRITTPFRATSTAMEVVAGIDLTGRRAIVTGAAAGIGVETARALAAAGAEVTLAVRDTAAGESAARDITSTTGGKRVFVAALDLADQASVAAFVAGWRGPLHILVNNAGVAALPETRTPEGWELQFATNHLGHFALTTGLHGALVEAGGARVVSVSSSGHLRSPVVFEDIHFRERPYDPFLAYAQSKTANILFAVEATRRWAAAAITVNALMPGRIRTKMQRRIDETFAEATRARAGAAQIFFKTPEQGAATSVLVATSPLLEGIGGRYFEDCAEAGPGQPNTDSGVADYALDPLAAERLWQVSVETLAQARRGGATG
jgi:O-methyltransferase involved in polyketide biosynthesis/NAD(P)-dependent dehydrogenase (short-subunit alcohol dehydrogenase family)